MLGGFVCWDLYARTWMHVLGQVQTGKCVHIHVYHRNKLLGVSLLHTQ